jgi:ferritin-like protein
MDSETFRAPWRRAAGERRNRILAANSLHEPLERLSEETLDMHRAVASLMEELEAVDWYAQRVDATEDEELARVLAHNRDEEKEHACMTLEWIRRRDPAFDRYLRKFLFSSGPIVDVEHGAAPTRDGNGRTSPELGIGTLRRENREEEEHA